MACNSHAHSEEVREQLRKLWTQVPKLSTAAIGREMGLNKNKVVGLSHRMGLPPRPSSIRKGGTSDTPQLPKPDRHFGVASLPPMPSVDSPVVLAVAVVPNAPIRAVKPVFVAPPKPPAPKPYARIMQCCWVTNVGRLGVGVAYCDDPTLPNKPYCEDHAKRCFVRVRDRREDVADAAD